MQLTNALCDFASLESISCPQRILSKQRREKIRNHSGKKNSRPTYPVEHTKRHHPFHSMTSTSLRWFYSGTAWYLSVADRNSSCCCLRSSSSVRPLCSILLCFFSRDYNEDRRSACALRCHNSNHIIHIPSAAACVLRQQRVHRRYNHWSRDPAMPSPHVHKRWSSWPPSRWYRLLRRRSEWWIQHSIP